jgi:hypothetical protein
MRFHGDNNLDKYFIGVTLELFITFISENTFWPDISLRASKDAEKVTA